MLDKTSAPAPVIVRTPADFETFRIKPSDTNRMALFLDPIRDKVPIIGFVEVFDRDGATPPNTHIDAYEMFYVLEGEGVATCAGQSFPIKKGDFFSVSPGHEHIVTNTGESRLYCITFMIPNEGFAELVRSGVKEPLDAGDLATLTKPL
jgi:mannose-6-phosphate isomerase-like protein (cupin superfamily)